MLKKIKYQSKKENGKLSIIWTAIKIFAKIRLIKYFYNSNYFYGPLKSCREYWFCPVNLKSFGILNVYVITVIYSYLTFYAFFHHAGKSFIFKNYLSIFHVFLRERKKSSIFK